MKVEFDYENALFEITEEIAKIPRTLKSNSKTFMSKASKIVKKNVEEELTRHKSDLDTEATNYDGTPYIHMKDDVKVSVKDDKEGTVYAIIRGGKYTGYKWHLVNNGHLDRNNNTVSATHFIDNALKKSESEVDEMADKLIQEVVNNG
jgi:hypothetical protein